MLFKSLILVLATFCCNSCLQTENSSSRDGVAPEGGLSFVAASEVFNNRCTGCHHDYHLLSEVDFFDFGLAIVGDSERSPIYYRLIGSAGAFGPKNMPGTPLSSEEMSAIKNWIDQAN